MNSNPPEKIDTVSDDFIEAEIYDLEQRLEHAKSRLRARKASAPNGVAHHFHNEGGTHQQPTFTLNASPHKITHFFLLLSDSALPLGSFAFSSGLESYLAHSRSAPPLLSSRPRHSQFDLFLPISVSSYASTTLPFVLAAHREPSRLADLDDYLDAAVMCTVGKRASVAQGRALLGIWERSFAASEALSAAPARGAYGGGDDAAAAALLGLGEYSRTLRTPAKGFDETGLPPVAAHLAPLFGVICRVVGLSLHQTAYIFMLGHVKALISAAVRASLLGPYQAQRVLASSEVMGMITSAIDRESETPVEEAGQSVPMMDLWVGRHEILYSRIFNS
ncbi:hypothetical protein Daus18300_006488 [Diaporthe australafricana]|uniref:Urease accessory protein UreF n=1 Tax=Diaporthe australafricana TaxID=127596 RepID=A0ABR3WUD2_9PEZI